MRGGKVKILVKQNNRNNSIHCNNKGARAREARARPFVVSVPAVVSVVLFDQNLDQKIDLGWPGSSPGLGQGQALGKIAPIFPRASQDVKKWRPRDFFGILELESRCASSSWTGSHHFWPSGGSAADPLGMQIRGQDHWATARRSRRFARDPWLTGWVALAQRNGPGN